MDAGIGVGVAMTEIVDLMTGGAGCVTCCFLSF